jgi:hypothetical protein
MQKKQCGCHDLDQSPFAGSPPVLVRVQKRLEAVPRQMSRRDGRPTADTATPGHRLGAFFCRPTALLDQGRIGLLLAHECLELALQWRVGLTMAEPPVVDACHRLSPGAPGRCEGQPTR